MFQVNKKRWAFICGCIIAATYVSIIKLGLVAPVPATLSSHPEFVFEYYPSVISAFVAFAGTILMVIIMNKLIGLCTSEHTFWLILPSCIYFTMATLTAKSLFNPMFYAAMPALAVLVFTAIYFRLSKLKTEALTLSKQ